MTKHFLPIFFLVLLMVRPTAAQTGFRQANSMLGEQSFGLTGKSGNTQHGSNRVIWGRDTTSTKEEKEIPIGLFQWKIDPQLGTVIPSENTDTVPHLYSSFNNTDGYNGEYSYLGNLGSPRLSRIFMNRDNDENVPFLFLSPLSYAHSGLRNLLFTNTLSPITNLSYHSCGTRQNGEDRVRVYFASNINKISGFGFKVDYLYGRGYYAASQNSDITTDFFGYYRGERYEMHARVGIAHQKNAESGGIEDDRYIHDPQSFPQRFGSRDIPVLLDDVFNRNDHQDYHLSHRYYLGYYRDIPVPDSLKPQMPSDAQLLLGIRDSLRQIVQTDSVKRGLVLDSLRNKWTMSQVNPKEFIPAASIIHTLNISHLNHKYYEGRRIPASYHTHDFFGPMGDLRNRTTGLRIRNNVGLAMREGFRKWVKMGITAYAAHEFEQYAMPLLTDTLDWTEYRENHIIVGGEISKYDGQMLHYNVTGEITLAGDDIGDFNVEGNADLNIPLGKRDTVRLDAKAYIKHLTPDFYYEHYHARHTWWDNDLSQELRTRIEGTLSNKRTKTRLRVGVENITNYTHMAIVKTLLPDRLPENATSRDYSHDVQVRQKDGSVQVFSVTLGQDFRLGPLNWENEITYQTTSDEQALPLPALNVYSNLYLLFRVARVLRVEIGGDIRYFTRYYAPDYAPTVGQFAVQDNTAGRIKIGNYPIVNAYANLHLKRCRIYACVNHVNAGTGNMFLAPHYPINPLTIHWGVSWNFFN